MPLLVLLRSLPAQAAASRAPAEVWLKRRPLAEVTKYKVLDVDWEEGGDSMSPAERRKLEREEREKREMHARRKSRKDVDKEEREALLVDLLKCVRTPRACAPVRAPRACAPRAGLSWTRAPSTALPPPSPPRVEATVSYASDAALARAAATRTPIPPPRTAHATAAQVRYLHHAIHVRALLAPFGA